MTSFATGDLSRSPCGAEGESPRSRGVSARHDRHWFKGKCEDVCWGDLLNLVASESAAQTSAKARWLLIVSECLAVSLCPINTIVIRPERPLSLFL
jgi:hypothetical protein